MASDPRTTEEIVEGMTAIHPDAEWSDPLSDALDAIREAAKPAPPPEQHTPQLIARNCLKRLDSRYNLDADVEIIRQIRDRMERIDEQTCCYERLLEISVREADELHAEYEELEARLEDRLAKLSERDDDALHFFCGAWAALHAVGHTHAEWVADVTVYLIATRGYNEVKALAEKDFTTTNEEDK